MSKIEDNYQNFLFDCDGVILNSNSIKTEGFRFALQNEDKFLIDEFIEYHKNNQGISRYEKIKYFLENIKKTELKQDSYNETLERYANFCKKELLKAELVPGISNFLERLRLNNNKCFVISGSDQKELINVFNKRNLHIYFSKILGSPKNKYDNTSYLIDNNIINSSTVYFGDAHSDYQVANKFNFDFYYIHSFSDWKNGIDFCKNNGIKILKDFSDI